MGQRREGREVAGGEEDPSRFAAGFSPTFFFPNSIRQRERENAGI